MNGIREKILAARILIVDDQEANVAMMEQLLENDGYIHVESTMDPSTVAAKHRANSFDLILLDLQMPRVDGFEVIEALKANCDGDYLPVIVLTAQPGHKIRALRAGIRDFISKPLDLVEVRTRIRNMLEVRVLYTMLERANAELEAKVRERTAELRESRARYQSLTELASDWYWEQDESGRFTRVNGPVLEMLGIRVDALQADPDSLGDAGWISEEREVLRSKVENREPFLEMILNRTTTDGRNRRFRVSGEPMFNESLRFVGYRGIGVEVTEDG